MRGAERRQRAVAKNVRAVWLTPRRELPRLDEAPLDCRPAAALGHRIEPPEFGAGEIVEREAAETAGCGPTGRGRLRSRRPLNLAARGRVSRGEGVRSRRLAKPDAPAVLPDVKPQVPVPVEFSGKIGKVNLHC